MSPDQDSPTSENIRGKDETELPIGQPHEPALQEPTMWRCIDCGAMGQLTSTIPLVCPECNAPKEELYYWSED